MGTDPSYPSYADFQKKHGETPNRFKAEEPLEEAKEENVLDESQMEKRRFGGKWERGCGGARHIGLIRMNISGSNSSEMSWLPGILYVNPLTLLKV